MLFPVGNSHDANLVSRAQRQSTNAPPRRRITSNFRRRKNAVCRPFIYYLIAYQYAKTRVAIVLIEVHNVHFVPPCVARKTKRSRASPRLQTFDCFAAGSVFPRNDVHGRVALELHGFRFDAIGINSHTVLRIGYAGSAKEPVADGISPDNCVRRLIFKPGQNVSVTLLIDATSQRFPLMDVLRGAFRAFVMRVVNVLNHSFAGLQHACVGHVVKEEQQLVRRGFQRLVQLGSWRRILSYIAGPGGHGTIHADPVTVSAVPLAPAVALGRFHSGSVVTSKNVRECLGSKWAGVVFIDFPRIDLHAGKGTHDGWIVSKSQPRPSLSDCSRTQLGIPRQAAEPV